MPKALLHDHLDGGLRPATVIELADEIGWALPASSEEELQAWFTRGAETKDLLQYLATFEHTLAVMQTPEHVERVAAEAVVDLAADGVVYAEVRFAPELHGTSPAAAVEAVAAGFRRGEREAAAVGHADLGVDHLLRDAHGRPVVGDRPPGRLDAPRRTEGGGLRPRRRGDRVPAVAHADALAFARQRHLNVTIHASEPPDLELIDDALVHGAHRIGHGVRLGRDTTPDPSAGGLRLGPLARYVLDQQVHLELAPTCNVQIGAVESVAAHPIGPFLRAGFSVGVNTDNRLMSGVLPSSELAAVTTAFDLTRRRSSAS